MVGIVGDGNRSVAPPFGSPQKSKLKRIVIQSAEIRITVAARNAPYLFEIDLLGFWHRLRVADLPSAGDSESEQDQRERLLRFSRKQ